MTSGNETMILRGPIYSSDPCSSPNTFLGAFEHFFEGGDQDQSRGLGLRYYFACDLTKHPPRHALCPTRGNSWV